MKQVIFNEDNLTDEEIDKVQKKSRGLIFDNKGHVLLVHYANLYMLPGGSIEKGENASDALKRELSEEAGMEITPKEPFLEITSYDSKYLDRKTGNYINRKTQTTFFALHIDQPINFEHQHLIDSEIRGNFSIQFTNLSVARYLIETNDNTNPKNKQFRRETLTMLDEYEKLFQEQNKDDYER